MMKHIYKAFGLLFALLISQTALAGSGITYHGRLVDPSGHAVIGSNVQFRIQLRTPGNENCLLYEEIQAKDLSQTEGVFAVTINDGSGVRTDTSGYGIDQIFANRGNFAFAAGQCVTGSTYGPNPTDGRKIQVYFNDGVIPAGQWEAMPSMAINFVPMSIESQQIGGYKKEQLIKVADGVNTSQTEFNTTSWTDLLALIAGTSNKYVKPTDQVTQLYGATVPAPANGQSIRWNTALNAGSGGWENFTAGSASGTVTSVGLSAPGEFSVTGSPVTASGTLGLSWANQTTNKVFASPNGSTGAPTFRGLASADIPALPWSKITSGIPTTIAGYGITDAITNGGTTPSISSGLDIGRPAAGTAGRLYIAYDASKIYRDNGTTWDTVSSHNTAAGDIVNGGNTTGATVTIGTNDAQSLALETGGTTKMTILNSGNVGIGTTNPGSLLSIDNGNTNYTAVKTGSALQIGNSVATGIQGRFGVVNSSSFAFQIANANDSNGYSMLLNPYGGNVGIGTTNPGSKLDVSVSQNASTFIGVSNTTNNTFARAGLSISSNAANLQITSNSTLSLPSFSAGRSVINELSSGGLNISAQHASGEIRFITGGSTNERMRISSVGNVGIGTTTPGQKLEVNGGVRLNTATAKPTCDSTTRGTFWMAQGGAGVKDAVEVCAKDAADAYSWRTLY